MNFKVKNNNLYLRELWSFQNKFFEIIYLNKKQLNLWTYLQIILKK